MKTIKFYTLGCKVNQYDTQRIREQLVGSGFRELRNGEPADIYVINTCTVTSRADSDSLMFVRKSKRENQKAKIIVTGCLAELDENRIKEIDKNIITVKNRDKECLPELLNSARGKGIKNGITCFEGHTRAFLKIQDGCDNFCSYCKVPLVRGNCRSKPLKEVVKEAQQLAENGYKEIILSGICLGSYGKDLAGKLNLIDAIVVLEKIEKIWRIRLSSIEAGDVSDELIKKIAGSGKICRHLHIPIQSGDNQVLKKMRRKYTRNDYLKLIRKIKEDIPGVAVTTDCMVGFPGETEANFENTLDLIKKITPLRVHVFPYSQREGTFAEKKYKTAVEPSLVKDRIARFKRIAEECSLNYKRQFVNNYLNVLIEGRFKGDDCFWEGYSDNYIKVLVKSKLDLKNQLVSVRIKQVKGDFCEGKLCRRKT